MNEIDRIAIAELEKQYGIPRSVLHDRMNALGIKRTRIGNKAYIDGGALQLLNDLDAHMKRRLGGGSFPRQHSLAKQPMALFLESVGKSKEQTDLTVARQDSSQTEILIKAIAYLMNQQPVDEFQSRRKLKEVAEEGWQLSTSELLTLLMRSSIPPLDDHQRFSRMGFTFWQVGKGGRQYEWRVSKVEP